jgi:hypothetical protein
MCVIINLSASAHVPAVSEAILQYFESSLMLNTAIRMKSKATLHHHLFVNANVCKRNREFMIERYFSIQWLVKRQLQNSVE